MTHTRSNGPALEATGPARARKEAHHGHAGYPGPRPAHRRPGWRLPWSDVVRDSATQLHVGEALYKAGDPAQPAAWQDPAELSRHLTLAKTYPEVRGHVFFAAREVGEDKIGAMARVVADHYRRPARTPR